MNVRVEISEDELNDLVKKRIQSQFPNTRLVSDAVTFEKKVVTKAPEPVPPTDPKDPAPVDPVPAVPAGEIDGVPSVEKSEDVITWESVSCRAVCELTTAEKKTE